MRRDDTTDDEDYEVEAKPPPHEERNEGINRDADSARDAEHTDGDPPRNNSIASGIKLFTTCH